jgi:hypothetical protein
MRLGVPAWPLEGGRWPLPEGVPAVRGRGAVPVGADDASSTAPHDAQNRAWSPTGSEQAGQCAEVAMGTAADRISQRRAAPAWPS